MTDWLIDWLIKGGMPWKTKKPLWFPGKLKLIHFFAITSFSVATDRLEKRVSTHRARPSVGKEKNQKISQDAYQYNVFIFCVIVGKMITQLQSNLY